MPPIAVSRAHEVQVNAQGLARVGEYDLVYDLLASEDEHSWANMLREGATTCFEAWGNDQKWNTSLCHPWASSPIIVMIEDLIGLHPGSPGWKTITFTPHIPAGLKNVTLELPTKQGRIRVSNPCYGICTQTTGGVTFDN